MERGLILFGPIEPPLNQAGTPLSSDHVVPFQPQVVVGSALPTGSPPASTTIERAASYAKPYPSLGGGDAAGVSRVQAAPFQVHVSIVPSAADVELWTGAMNKIIFRMLS